MYPFVRLPKGMGLNDPMSIFMSNIASTTILETMQGVCDLNYQTGDYFSPGEGPLRFYQEIFDPSYFKDVGKHFRQSDEMVGLEIVSRKLQRMREKLTAWDYQEFDSFERFLFFSILTVARRDGASRQREEQEKTKKWEKKVKKELIKGYGCRKKLAKKLAKHLCRSTKMMPSWDGKPKEKGLDLYTTLDDYMQIWNFGFLNGVRFLSTLGSALGYGYDATLKLFTDIGVKPPLTLVGTREGNKIAAEVMINQAVDIFLKTTSDLLGEMMKKGDLGEEVELTLEELSNHVDPSQALKLEGVDFSGMIGEEDFDLEIDLDFDEEEDEDFGDEDDLDDPLMR